MAVYLKLDSQQITGSFKLRGASNAVAALADAPRGVVTHSSGNHGAAAAAYAAPAVAATAGAAPVADARTNKNAVTAPMVGTAYLSPAPGARAFIEVGATVKEGQTILIIEAMKTMNQIPAPRSGKVTEILVQDASPVEYGEPLIVIE